MKGQLFFDRQCKCIVLIAMDRNLANKINIDYTMGLCQIW